MTHPTPTDSQGLDFQVRRDDLRTTRLVPLDVPEALEPGQALLRVDPFAFTANNVTYAVAGDMMGYWNFFPATGGWGRVPVWGFADVVRSAAEGVAEGDRYFGYFPMSTHLVVSPVGASPAGFTDGAPHRAALPPVYNQYVRTAADPLYDPDHEAHAALLRPLFVTSFLLDDFLADEGFFGAEAVVVSSASSKTSIALAFLLSQRGTGRPAVVGLTSERNVPFVTGLGAYDQVLRYDEVTTLRAERPTVYVDVAGDREVLSAVHGHLRDALRHTAQVGLTHWEHASGGGDALPGPKPTFFFAPTRIQKRIQDWGPAKLQERLADAWGRFVAFTEGWMRVVTGRGPEAVERVYRETLEGRTKPDEGHVISLWP